MKVADCLMNSPAFFIQHDYYDAINQTQSLSLVTIHGEENKNYKGAETKIGYSSRRTGIKSFEISNEQPKSVRFQESIDKLPVRKVFKIKLRTQIFS